MARRLAGLLAAVPVISLPVVRIVQDRLLPESRQVHVAEVFLGGLLKPLGETRAKANPDAVQYDFLDGVREVLLESVPTSVSVNVLEEVSKFVAERLGLSLDAFAAVLRNPQESKKRGLVDQSRPFAMVTAQILQQLGGEYAQFAKDLERLHQGNSQSISPSLRDEQIIRLNASEFLRACDPSSAPSLSVPVDRDYYIDFASVRGGNIIQELKQTISIRSDKRTCQLFTGHIGCGKSTELLRLKTELEQLDFYVVYFVSTEDLDMSNVDVTDIFIAIAHQVSEKLEAAQIKLKPEYFANLLAEVSAILQALPEIYQVDFAASIGKITARTKDSLRLRKQLWQYIEPRTNGILQSLNAELLGQANLELKQHSLV